MRGSSRLSSPGVHCAWEQSTLESRSALSVGAVDFESRGELCFQGCAIHIITESMHGVHREYASSASESLL